MNEHMLNRVTQGDTIEKMKLIGDKSVDMLLVDLPYGTTQNRWDSIIPLDMLWREYDRIVKDDGAMVFTATGMFASQLMLSNPRHFKYKYIWVKSKATNFLNAKRQPLRKFEEVLVFYRKPPTYNPQMGRGVPYNKGSRKNQVTGSYGSYGSVVNQSDGARYPSDVLHFSTAETEGEVFHPTQKPVALGRFLVRTYTNPGDTVLDNTSGSGAFLVAALMEGRNFIGIEKNEHGELFKREPVDYIERSHDRLIRTFNDLDDSVKSSILRIGLFKDM